MARFMRATHGFWGRRPSVGSGHSCLACHWWPAWSGPWRIVWRWWQLGKNFQHIEF